MREPNGLGVCIRFADVARVRQPARTQFRRWRSCQETRARSVRGPWPRATCAPQFSSWESVMVPQVIVDHEYRTSS
jgi:hypothetical protein